MVARYRKSLMANILRWGYLRIRLFIERARSAHYRRIIRRLESQLLNEVAD